MTALGCGVLVHCRVSLFFCSFCFLSGRPQVFYDWLAGVGQAIPENVFEPEKTDGKPFAKTSPR